MEKKIMDTTMKTGIDAATTTSKRVPQKKQTKKKQQKQQDLIGNKVADKINSVGKTKNKGKEKDKEDETNKSKDIYIPPEKRQQTIDDLRLL